jgi:hypothetical protein
MGKNDRFLSKLTEKINNEYFLPEKEVTFWHKKTGIAGYKKRDEVSFSIQNQDISLLGED